MAERIQGKMTAERLVAILNKMPAETEIGMFALTGGGVMLAPVMQDGASGWVIWEDPYFLDENESGVQDDELEGGAEPAPSHYS